MKWLLLCFLPFLVQAQSLKPGTYYNLKPSEPIILDTGSYTFIGLYFSLSSGEGRGEVVWLDARNARNLELNHCTFEGQGEGTVVLSSGHLRVQNCRFENLGVGILQESPSGETRKVSVVSNMFKDNLVAVKLARAKRKPDYGLRSVCGLQIRPICRDTCPAEHVTQRDTGLENKRRNPLSLEVPPDLALVGNIFTDNTTAISVSRKEDVTADVNVNFVLRCNIFEHDATDLINRTGLRIGEGVKVNAPNGSISDPNAIGGSGEFNTTGIAYPNANVWPTSQTDRGAIRNLDPFTNEPADIQHWSLGWPDAGYWVSIENNNQTSITYWRYDNEFVQNQTTTTPFVAFDPVEHMVATQGNVDDTNPIHNVVDPNDPNYEHTCDTQTDPWPVLFPARIAVVSGNLKKSLSFGPLLREAIPNPSQKETRINIYLPETTEQAILQVTESGTGRVLQNIPIDKRGELEVFLEVSKSPAGSYGYRLIVDGKPIDSKKFVVIH